MWYHATFASCLLCLLLAGLPQTGPAATPTLDATAPVYEQAVEAFNRGDYRSAVERLKQVLQEDSRHLGARTLLGRIHLRLGRPAAARKELLAAGQLGADPNLIATLLAKAYYFERDFRALLEDIRLDGLSPQAQAQVLVLRGRALMEQGRLDEAENAFARAESLAADSADALLGRALVLLRQHDYSRAAEYVERAARQAPDEPEVWTLRGDLKRFAGNLPAALSAYAKALALERRNVGALKGRAAVLIDMNRDEEALGDIKAVREILPDDPQANYLYALLLARQGQTEQATEALARAAEVLESLGEEFILTHPPSLLLAGVISYQRQDYDRAYHYLDRYLRVAPRSQDARRLFGEVLFARGATKRAIEVLEPMLKNHPDDVRLLATLGSAYLQKRRYAEATRLLERAAALAPEATSIRTQLALGHLAVGRHDTALEELRAAAATGEDPVKAATLLALVYLKLGAYRQALEVGRTLVRTHPDQPASYMVQGAAEVARGDIAAGRRSYAHALELDPDHRVAIYNLAHLDQLDGEPERARQRYLEILSRWPGETRAMVELAQLAETHGDLEEAIQWREKLRAAAPDAVEPQLPLVDLYVRSGDASQAITVARALEARHPGDFRVTVALGRAIIAAGREQDAVAVFRRASRLAGHDPQRLHAVAHYQASLRDYEGARWSLRKAARSESDYLPARAALVELEAHAGRLDKALELARTLRAQRPTLALSHRLVGDVLLQMGRPHDAALAFEEALRHEPDSPALAIRLYRARARLPEPGPTQAIRGLRAWVEQHPGERQTRTALAAAYASQGRIRQAIALTEKLAAAAPDDLTTLNNLAALYTEVGDPRSVAVARKAYQLAPAQPAVLDTYGWALVRAGQPDRGLVFLREASVRSTGEPSVRYHLAAALATLGRRTEAAAELRQALRGGGSFTEAPQAQALLEELSAE